MYLGHTFVKCTQKQNLIIKPVVNINHGGAIHQLSGVRSRSCFKYAHSCIEIVILFSMSINNPSLKSAVLESSAKPILGFVWQKI